MPTSPTASDDGEGDRLPLIARVNILANMAKFMAGTTRVLERLGVSPVSNPAALFRPYFDVLHRIALERHLETSGIEALREFTNAWDAYSNSMQAGLKPEFFSAREVSVMSDAISRFKAWLHRHLPDACEYGYGTEI